MISNFDGYTRWSFKSLLIDRKWHLVISAGVDTDYSVLHQKANGRNAGKTRQSVRRIIPDSDFQQLLRVRIPKPNPNVKEFDFCYVARHEDTGVGENLVALRWAKELKGKRDWGFAMIRNSITRQHKFVPLGPRKEIPTPYSILIHKNKLKIHVTGGRIYKQSFPLMNKNKTFYRFVGINLYQKPIRDVEVSVFYSRIW